MRVIRIVGRWFGERLQIGAPIAEALEHPGAAQHRELGLRVRQRRVDVFGLQIVTGVLLAMVYVPVRGRGVGQPSDAQSSRRARMVRARAARMGIERDGGDRPRPHGAGVPLRRAQVSARADLDRRRVPAALHARHGLHRSGAALRPGRLLGPRHRRVDRRAACPCIGPALVHDDARRTDHRGRHALALVRAARVHRARAC